MKSRDQQVNCKGEGEGMTHSLIHLHSSYHLRPFTSLEFTYLDFSNRSTLKHQNPPSVINSVRDDKKGLHL